jgi:hypothetical protein
VGSKLMIAAGAAAGDAEELPSGVRTLIDEADEILVVTPTLPGRLEWLASATDKAREQADARLQAVLGELDEADAETQGVVGSDDPLDAIADGVREFGPDHLLIALRGGEQAGWQEGGLLDAIQERTDVPVTVFTLTGE